MSVYPGNSLSIFFQLQLCFKSFSFSLDLQLIKFTLMVLLLSLKGKYKKTNYLRICNDSAYKYIWENKKQK